MGVYLNPGNGKFKKALIENIYVDKSGLITKMNDRINKENCNICVSRPRRFGKSMNLGMLAAYYSCGCDSREMFDRLLISKDESYSEHLNKYNVVYINMQDFLSGSQNIDEMLQRLFRRLWKDIRASFPDVELDKEDGITFWMDDIYQETKIPFVVLIDEWDCVMREHMNDKEAQKVYLDFLRSWLKDKEYVALAYMTGILPIKKYGTHSALNMFDEYSMVDSADIANCIGFTEDEVEHLCTEYGMNIEQMRYWYDGYQLNDHVHLYCPRSVIASISRKRFDSYWSKTETFEALSKYISFDFDGLNEAVSRLLAGERVAVNIRSFQNDMYSMQIKDDILTLLIHLGYLGYLFDTKEVFIPNKEIFDEFVTAMTVGNKWKKTIEAVQESKELLELTINGKADKVAEHIEKVHREGCDPKHYNSEQALRYTVLIAYFYAREKYTIIQEMPAGNGFADILLMPNFQNPDGIPIIIELKYDQSADSAITQIKNRHYPDAVKGHKKILLVGINYDKDSTDKKHECVIEEFTV